MTLEQDEITTPGDGVWCAAYYTFWKDYGVEAPPEIAAAEEEDYFRGYHEAIWPQADDAVPVDLMEKWKWFDGEPPAYRRGYHDGFKDRCEDGVWYPTY
jgi:hypothetical protein